MKKMKKILALIAAMAIAAAALSACNGSDNSSKTSTASTAASAQESKTSADESKTDSDESKASADESKTDASQTSEASSTPAGNSSGIMGEEDLADKKIAVQNGTTGAIIAEDYVDASKGGEVQYFSSYSEAVLALTQSKVDCVILDEQPAKAFAAMNDGLTIVDKELTDEDYAAVIAKSNTDLLNKVNTALAELKADGTLDKIVASYIPEEGQEAGSYHYVQTTTSGDKLVLATSADFPPYEYYEGTDIVGIDIEIGKAVADKLGRVLEVQDMKFDAIIPSVDSGKADIGFSGFTVTDERKLMINFTENYAHSKQVILVRE